MIPQRTLSVGPIPSKAMAAKLGALVVSKGKGRPVELVYTTPTAQSPCLYNWIQYRPTCRLQLQNQQAHAVLLPHSCCSLDLHAWGDKRFVQTQSPDLYAHHGSSCRPSSYSILLTRQPVLANTIEAVFSDHEADLLASANNILTKNETCLPIDNVNGLTANRKKWVVQAGTEYGHVEMN